MPHKTSINLAATIAVLALAGCSNGPDLRRLNPVTWFGNDAAAEASPEAEASGQLQPSAAPVAAQPADGRPMVAEVTRARLEPTRFGAILRADGRMAYPRLAMPDLRPVNSGQPDAEGVLRFDMVAQASGGSGGGTGFSLDAAVFGDRTPAGAAAEPTVPASAGAFIAADVLAQATALVVRARGGDYVLRLR